MEFASAPEVLAHRIVWAAVLLVPGVVLLGEGAALRALRQRDVAWLFVSACLLAFNWLIFVWALFNGRMVEASLGYYINPLMTVCLGVLFLGERPRPGQWAAVLIAGAGIANEVVGLGLVPWAGLSLAVTFALYGLVRRKVGVPSFVGLTVETSLMFPFACAFMFWQWLGAPEVSRTGGELGLLALGGLVTIFPLLCFAHAALRVPFTVLGFVQYLAPSITLALAVLVYHQAVQPERWVTFALIWLAIAVFSAEGGYHGWRLNRRHRHAAG